MEIFDIAILGLGPAGANFARCLSEKYSVIAFDKKAEEYEESGFQKPCGGLLAEDAQDEISKQGLVLPKSVLADPQLFSVRTIDLQTKIERTYRRFYINMNRHKFDLWLKSLISQSRKILNKTSVVSFKKEKDGLWLIEYREAGKSVFIKAKYFIGADGASSKLRQKLYPDVTIRTYTVMQQWFVDKQLLPLYACFFDSELTDCYGWAVSKDSQLVLGAAFPEKDVVKRYEKFCERVRAAGFNLDNIIRSEGCKVLRPNKMGDFCMGKENAFLIGEAAGLISPSSLEGLSYALRSSAILADIFNNGTERDDFVKKYWKKTFKLRLKVFLKNLKSPFMYHPFLRKIIMKFGPSL